MKTTIMKFINKSNFTSQYLWKYNYVLKPLVKKTILLLVIFLPFMCNSQTIEKFSIDSGGASTVAGGIEILYTIGEVNVAERASATIAISEGFVNGSFSQTLGLTNPEVSANQISIYPNPTMGIINIKSNETIDYLEVYSVLGQLVINKDYNTQRLNMDKLKSGVYILKVYSGSNISTYRVMKR